MEPRPANPFRTSLRRDPADPRPLLERINAQILERIEEAVEMAGLQLMVELRQIEGRRAPETTSTADRAEFEARGREVLAAIGASFREQLEAGARAALARAEAEGRDDRARLLAGQVHLARTLPDYWQRLEVHIVAHRSERLAEAARPRGWLRRMLGR